MGIGGPTGLSMPPFYGSDGMRLFSVDQLSRGAILQDEKRCFRTND